MICLVQTTYINGLQTKSVDSPADLKEIFTPANTYLKPKVVTGSGGSSSALATTTDTINNKPGEGNGKRQRGKHQQN
jgi:hypothetical protein